LEISQQNQRRNVSRPHFIFHLSSLLKEMGAFFSLLRLQFMNCAESGADSPFVKIVIHRALPERKLPPKIVNEQ
jgi:hypothetical protein